MHKVIYICSLSHSGSTLLSLMTAAHPRVLGLGEIENTLRRIKEEQKICTCGSRFDECPFWGTILGKIRAASERPALDEFCGELLRKSSDIASGDDAIICDASKSLAGIRNWQKFSNVDLRVVFLIKDVRSFMISFRDQLDKANKVGRNNPDGAERINRREHWKTMLLKLTPLLPVEWFRKNARIQRFLAGNNIRHMRLGYEELCFNPEAAMTRLSDFADLEYHGGMCSPGKSNSHILRGNRMRFKSSEVRYDYRWMTSRIWMNLNALPYLRYNSRMVYSNDFR